MPLVTLPWPSEGALFTYINITIIVFYYFSSKIFCQFKNTSYVCIEE